jgi:hypothetical protein
MVFFAGKQPQIQQNDARKGPFVYRFVDETATLGIVKMSITT